MKHLTQHIRAATFSDAEALVALSRDASSAPQWTNAVWLQMIESSVRAGAARVIVVAEMRAQICGLLVAHDIAGIVELESIAVHTGAQRWGVGRRLMAELKAWSRERSARGIELEVRESNGGAVAFYRAMGFDVYGTRPRYYADPEEAAVLMRASLDDAK